MGDTDLGRGEIDRRRLLLRRRRGDRRNGEARRVGRIGERDCLLYRGGGDLESRIGDLDIFLGGDRDWYLPIDLCLRFGTGDRDIFLGDPLRLGGLRCLGESHPLLSSFITVRGGGDSDSDICLVFFLPEEAGLVYLFGVLDLDLSDSDVSSSFLVCFFVIICFLFRVLRLGSISESVSVWLLKKWWTSSNVRTR